MPRIKEKHLDAATLRLLRKHGHSILKVKIDSEDFQLADSANWIEGGAEPFGMREEDGVIIMATPFPPSVNAYWRTAGTTHYIGKPGKRFLARMKEIVPRTVKPLTGFLILTAVFCPPSVTERDLDNYPKALMDSLAKTGVIVNDVQIREMHTRWGPKVKGGRVDLTLTPFERSTWLLANPTSLTTRIPGPAICPPKTSKR